MVNVTEWFAGEMASMTSNVVKSILAIFLILIIPTVTLAEIQVYDANDQYVGVLIDADDVGLPYERQSFYRPDICKRFKLGGGKSIGYFPFSPPEKYDQVPEENESLEGYYDNPTCEGTKYFHFFDSNVILYDHDKEKFLSPSSSTVHIESAYYLFYSSIFMTQECLLLGLNGVDLYTIEEIDPPFTVPFPAPLKYRHNQQLILGPDKCP